MAIKLEDVSFSYGQGPVLSNISFELRDDDFAAIIGSNGAGKITLVRIMLGLLKPTGGKASILGSAPEKIDFRKIGYVPQKYNIDRIFPGTVREIFDLKGGSKAAETAKSLGIENLMDSKFAQLSGGQQQRVLIALSLLSGPKLLILDEPTVGVDAKAQQEFYALLKKLNSQKKVGIILVTHDVGMISKYVKTVICINGQVCCFGPAKDMNTMLKAVYGGDFGVFHHHDEG